MTLGVLASDDERFRGFDPDDVSVTNADDDTAGVTVNPRPGLSTTESGGTAEFTVVLNAQPAADVTIAIDSDNAQEGTVAPSSLTFTPSNWSAPQSVNVSGVDDGVADGVRQYQVLVGPITSDDEDFNSKPTADVVITVASSDVSEGLASPSTLTFTPTNWATPQHVLVTGQADQVVDGNQPYELTVTSVASSDARYDAMSVGAAALINADLDSTGVVVTIVDASSDESGAQAHVTYKLRSQPSADVVITLESSDASEGVASLLTLTFTPTDWSEPQAVYVAGQHDDVADGDQPYKLQVTSVASSDPGYGGLSVAAADLTNHDDDSVGITVTVSDNESSECCGAAYVKFALNSQPTADVVITLESSDLTEGTISPTTLTFTAMNWGAQQVVTISGQDDDVADGDKPYNLA